MEKVKNKIINEIYPRLGREVESHKYDYGLLLAIGGGEFYTGSPALAGLAGFRAGADMVQILAPERAANIIASFSPILAAYPLRGRWLDKEDVATIVSMTKAAENVSKGRVGVVIGNGLGRSDGTKQAVLDYLQETETKAVIDADGIHAVAENISVIKNRNFVITPHSYEFYILTGKDVKNFSFEQKVEEVKKQAASLGAVIVLKGKTDIISNGEETVINESGSPYMSVGGTGDTLAGICGALLARGIEPFLAAQAAAFINGKAGELAAKKYKQSMTAMDLIEEIPKAIRLGYQF